MPDAVTRLNAALKDRYSIDREIGRGGYVTELRPGRRPAPPRLGWVLPAIAAVALLGACEPASNGQQGDLLFTNARLIDGSGTPSRVADVRVRGDRILEIGNLTLGEAETEVEATGLVLAPGFIDTHAHWEFRTGDVLEPDDGMIGIGSGGPYALAAARADRARRHERRGDRPQGHGHRSRDLRLHQ